MPALLVSGGTFALIQFVWSNYIEIGLVDVVASIGSLLVSVAFLRHWRPAHRCSASRRHQPTAESAPRRREDVLVAWSPFILTSVFILVCGLPASARWLRSAWLAFPLTGLHNQVLRMPPLAPGPTPESAVMDLNLIPLPGTAVFAGALVSASLLGVPFRRVTTLMLRTWRRMIPSLVAISGHGRARVHHEVRGHGLRARPVAHRAPAGSIRSSARCSAGWAWRSPAPTPRSNALFGSLQTDHGRAARAEPDADGRGQQHGRRDGQDDRRPEHRRRRASPRGSTATRPRSSKPCSGTASCWPRWWGSS